MNYSLLRDSLIQKAYYEQHIGLRPATMYSKNAKSFSWKRVYVKGKQTCFPFSPKERYILYLCHRKLHIRDSLRNASRSKNARDFERIWKTWPEQHVPEDKLKYFKKCENCERLISITSKTGRCRFCVDRKGEKSSFFGKHHSEATKKLLHEKSSKSTKRLWENSEYREKVVTGKTGKKRSEAFKQKQRNNTTIQMKDPRQRELRSVALKKSWNEHRISSHKVVVGRNYSKEEIRFGEVLQKALADKASLLKRGVRIVFESFEADRCFCIPDFVFNDAHIIEYYGDFWHANPVLYNADDTIDCFGLSWAAQDIWNKDKKREELLESKGYMVHIVWAKDFKENPDQTIAKLLENIL